MTVSTFACCKVCDKERGTSRGETKTDIFVHNGRLCLFSSTCTSLLVVACFAAGE